jgi:N-acetylglucosaminylphosphatidylinositol deacetylase
VLTIVLGDSQGLGSVREKELTKSAASFGIPEDNVRCISDPQALPDSMSKAWASADVATHLDKFFLTAPSSTDTKAKASKEPRKPFVDIILTFDSTGVSSHPNHISLYRAAKDWTRGAREKGSDVELYSLTSTSILRKYLSILDVFATVLACAINMLQVLLSQGKGSRSKSSRDPKTRKRSIAAATASVKKERGKGLPFLFISNLWTWRVAQLAMTRAHVSQMVWFRWGWITLSRYMVVNDLRAVPLD